MKHFLNSKYSKWALTAMVVIAVGVTFYFGMLRMESVGDMISLINEILTPFFIGFVLAYLLRPVFNRVQRFLFRILAPRMKTEGKAKALSKALSTTVSILLFFVLLGGALSVVIPQVIASIYSIFLAAPAALEDFIVWMNALPFFDESTKETIENLVMNFQKTAINWVQTNVLPNLSEIVSQVSEGVVGAINILMNFIIGIIICIYILFSKETFAAQCKKTLYSLFEKERAEGMIRDMQFIDKVFNGYIVGKIIDSFAVGVICFVVMVIFQWPYAMLISVLIGVTNIIPFFGPFIGAIPSAVLILTVDPMACLYFIIFILIMQQVEGNIIAPIILGDSTGLSSFWVMFAILIGGGLFGFMGMIIGVPIFAVIYAFVTRWLNKRLKKKELPVATAAYLAPGVLAEEEVEVREIVMETEMSEEKERGTEED